MLNIAQTLKRRICLVVDPWYMLNNFCFHVYAQKLLFIAKQSFYESKATYISSVITEARGNFRHMYSDNVECIYSNDCDFQSQSHLNSNMIKLLRTVPIQYRVDQFFVILLELEFRAATRLSFQAPAGRACSLRELGAAFGHMGAPCGRMDVFSSYPVQISQICDGKSPPSARQP